MQIDKESMEEEQDPKPAEATESSVAAEKTSEI